MLPLLSWLSRSQPRLESPRNPCSHTPHTRCAGRRRTRHVARIIDDGWASTPADVTGRCRLQDITVNSSGRAANGCEPGPYRTEVTGPLRVGYLSMTTP